MPPRPASADGQASQSQTSTLVGRTVRLAGYMLPVDREGDFVYAFLLLQVAGACIHTPPPPADQLVLVTLGKPFKATGIYEPVSVVGTISADAEKVQLFMLDGVKVLDAGYMIDSAFVLAADPSTIK